MPSLKTQMRSYQRYTEQYKTIQQFPCVPSSVQRWKKKKITVCLGKWDSWQVGHIQFGDLTEEKSKDMGKQQSQWEQSELNSQVYDGTLAGTEAVSFCWGKTWGVVEAGTVSLYLICRSWIGCTAKAGGQWNGTDSAELEGLSVALSWVSPSSLSDKATGPHCSPSLHKSEDHPGAPSGLGGFYKLAEWEQGAEAAQILE